MIRVLILDDSALVRQLLTEMLGRAPDIEVVGVAADPYIARDKIKKLHPDVLTLDLEMPRMDGLTFLANLMRLRPMPVVVISSLTGQGADITLRALELGALEIIAKPREDGVAGLADYQEMILDKIRAAAKARVRSRTALPSQDPGPPGAAARLRVRGAHARTPGKLIGIGASTGGTEALKEVLGQLPPQMPGILICQHIPAIFCGPLAKRLDQHSGLTVAEARDGQPILPGHAYLAPGDHQLMVVRDGARYICRVRDDPPFNRHRPSVDVLFQSMADQIGSKGIGVMLTGMGADGVDGLGQMRQAGAHVIAQDEKTSVIWGMPREVVRRGFADEVLALGKIAGRLIQLAEE